MNVNPVYQWLDLLHGCFRSHQNYNEQKKDRERSEQFKEKEIFNWPSLCSLKWTFDLRVGRINAALLCQGKSVAAKTARLHSGVLLYRSFRYKVVSMQVYSVEAYIVSSTWLKERRIFTKNVFLVHEQAILEGIELFVQFHCLSSYWNERFPH